MTSKSYPEIIDDTNPELAKWAREVTRTRLEDIGDIDAVKNGIDQSVSDLTDAIAAVAVPVKASGSEIDTGTDDAKFLTAKAVNDSHNVPDVAPGTSGNHMTSNGTDWVSTAPTGIVQRVAATPYATQAALSTHTPIDDSVPTSTEGDQILTASITPSNTTNKILVLAKGTVCISTGAGQIAVALYRGSTCIDAQCLYSAGPIAPITWCFCTEDGPASASAQTYSIRVGANSVSVCCNGDITSGRRLGGSQLCTMELLEIAA